jgi:hypothetical protein
MIRGSDECETLVLRIRNTQNRDTSIAEAASFQYTAAAAAVTDAAVQVTVD